MTENQRPGPFTLTCQDCQVSFTVTAIASSQRKRCDSCRVIHSAELNKAKKKRLRARKHNPDRMRSVDTGEYILLCGHTLKLISRPMDGEYLPCERCGDWVEFVVDWDIPLCRNGRHRLTWWNRNRVGGISKSKDCRICREGMLS